MIYVIELLIDDGRKVLRFFDAAQEAVKLYEAVMSPLGEGVSIKGANGAFVEDAKLLRVETDSRREAKAAVVEGRAEVMRDSAVERQEFKDGLAKFVEEYFG